MTTEAIEIPVEEIDLGDMSLWEDGFPHPIFERLRKEDPVHWSPMATWEGEPGFWSITRAEDIHEISRRWDEFSSQRGGIVVSDTARRSSCRPQMFIAMDPPRHDRIKALFQRGFTPKRIAEHGDEIRAIVTRVLDRSRRAATTRSISSPGSPRRSSAASSAASSAPPRRRTRAGRTSR